MLIDARTTESGQVLRADVCIIGAGAAGVAIAKELAGTSLDVLLLESGGFERDGAVGALNEGKVTGERLDSPLERARLRMFGGTANHYAGWSRPLEALVFERRDWVPDSGWPLTQDDLVPYYRRASVALGLGPFEYDWPWWHRERGMGTAVLPDSDFATGMIQITINHPGALYRDALVAATNVRLCLWATAVELVLDADGTRLAGVEVATLTGRRFRAEARVYVLAAGGIETPRLLLASRRVRANGVGNEHDLVGRYFMEHLNLTCGAAVFARDWDAFALYRLQESAAAEPGMAPIKVLGYLAPRDDLQRRERLLAMEINISAMPFAVLEQLFRTLPPTERLSGLTIRDVAALASLPDRPAVAAGVRVVAEQAPNPLSRVTLLTERDALGVPRVALDWRPQASDRASLVRGLLAFARTLGRTGFGRLQLATGEAFGRKMLTGPSFVVTDPLADEFPGLDFTVGTGYHHMGTTRMHPDARHGVVDANCRVHSVPNLYVAGSAVFPTGGSAGPTFTLVALALRLADHLRREMTA
ncbi:MAG TPA: GMC family oxidoreductase [Candidatus Limnocylindria bacterium]|nr:GMC family oxidoreductase [Candidatus Limnocylindria bacterium]